VLVAVFVLLVVVVAWVIEPDDWLRWGNPWEVARPEILDPDDPAIDPAVDAQRPTDALRVRAFPFTAAVRAFIESHDTVYVVEQNRDGQMRTLLLAELDETPGLEPEACNGTNRLELHVFGTDEQARLIARLDNLGKGASGAAVQNLNLVLGVDEGQGLSA
jgi:hypothetical protein